MTSIILTSTIHRSFLFKSKYPIITTAKEFSYLYIQCSPKIVCYVSLPMYPLKKLWTMYRTYNIRRRLSYCTIFVTSCGHCTEDITLLWYKPWLYYTIYSLLSVSVGRHDSSNNLLQHLLFSISSWFIYQNN